MNIIKCITIYDDIIIINSYINLNKLTICITNGFNYMYIICFVLQHSYESYNISLYIYTTQVLQLCSV